VSTLVYLYAVLAEPIADAVTGIEGQPLRWIVGSGLAAAVSDVPSRDFEEEPLNRHVRDMGWLGPRAVAHQEVNSRLFEASDASLPLAFGSVFRDDARVQQLLSDESATLSAHLAKVRGCAEWVVAMHQLREPDAEDVVAASPRLRSLREQLAASPPGRSHLLRRQIVSMTRDESRRIRAQAVNSVLDTLDRVAVDVYKEPMPSDTVERPLLRASVLVRRDAEAGFVDELDRLRRRWPEPTYRLLLTGPWPAYRFGGLPNSDG
jgi:hypothetical protein